MLKIPCDHSSFDLNSIQFESLPELSIKHCLCATRFCFKNHFCVVLNEIYMCNKCDVHVKAHRSLMFYYTCILSFKYLLFIHVHLPSFSQTLFLSFSFSSLAILLLMYARVMLMVKKSMVSSINKMATAIHAQGDEEDSCTC